MPGISPVHHSLYFAYTDVKRERWYLAVPLFRQKINTRVNRRPRVWAGGQMSDLFEVKTSPRLRLDRRVEWFDDDSQCVLTVSHPHLDPNLWSEYGRGAVKSYRRHGVECAIDVDA